MVVRGFVNASREVGADSVLRRSAAMVWFVAWELSRTWARAKVAYLAGETAVGICQRLGISRSAFFAAAQAGG